MSKGQSDNTNKATKKFDYVAVMDRLGVTTATQLVGLTWFTGPTFPLPATANQKDTRLKCVNKPQTNSHPKQRDTKNRYM